MKFILERDSEFNWWEPESVSQEKSAKWITHEVTINTSMAGMWAWSYNHYFAPDMNPRSVSVHCILNSWEDMLACTVTLEQKNQRVYMYGVTYGDYYDTHLYPGYIGTYDPVTFGFVTDGEYGGQAKFRWDTDI